MISFVWCVAVILHHSWGIPAGPLAFIPSEHIKQGFIGCLFSDVCIGDEICHDDNLFGTCKPPSTFIHRYDLDTESALIMSDQLKQLLIAGFSWSDLFTQCVLRTTLLSYRTNSPVDLSVCDAAKTIIPRDTPVYPIKRDQLVQLHKYFVPEEEREPALIEVPSEAFYGYGEEPGVYSEDKTSLMGPRVNDYEESAPNFTSDDLEHLYQDIMGSAPQHGVPYEKPRKAKRKVLGGSKKRIQSKTYSNDEMEKVKRSYIKKMKRAAGDVQIIDKTWVWLSLRNTTLTDNTAPSFLVKLSRAVGAQQPFTSFELSNGGHDIYFHFPRGSRVSAEKVLGMLKNKNNTALVPGYEIADAGYGRKTHITKEALISKPQRFVVTFVVCGAVLAVVFVVIVVFCLRQYHLTKDDKLYDCNKSGFNNGDSTEAYKDLCRQRMQTKNSDSPERLHSGKEMPGSARSSTSSWSEGPSQTNMDISTGHVILSYMEQHLNNKDKLEAEWKTLCAYEADNTTNNAGNKKENAAKNRYMDGLPYDHTRVTLKRSDSNESDYINANFVVDHDPKSPAYIVTQGPLLGTVGHFWQIVWEQCSVVIVNLTCLMEGDKEMCDQYWPQEGSMLYNNYEVHLVSEHVWSEEYLVRSFYLKNITTGETRTVTQLHFLAWQEDKVPMATKAILDFRRKVNKSFKGRSSPIVVHCNDGCGRSGTYVLLDMVLSRLAKGVKEIDISATLEHLRDQRCDMVKTKEQYEFVLTAIAEEVHAMLKSMPQ